jgi:Integrase core domain
MAAGDIGGEVGVAEAAVGQAVPEGVADLAVEPVVAAVADEDALAVADVPGLTGEVEVGRGVLESQRQRLGQVSRRASFAFGRRLTASGLIASMGTVGDALDNAVAESFFATLECELLDRSLWPTRAGLRTAIFDFIEVFYNRQRPTRPSTTPAQSATSSSTHQQHPRPNHRVNERGSTPDPDASRPGAALLCPARLVGSLQVLRQWSADLSYAMLPGVGLSGRPRGQRSRNAPPRPSSTGERGRRWTSSG